MLKHKILFALMGFAIIGTGLKASDLEYSIDQKGLPEISFLGSSILEIVSPFWGPNWKYAHFELRKKDKSADEWQGRCADLSMNANFKWALDDNGGMSGQLDFDVAKATSPAIGGCLEFHPALKASSLKGKDFEPILLGKKGWEWNMGDDRIVRITFDPELPDIYFERGNKGRIRCVFYSNAVTEGRKSYKIRIELPKDAKRIASLSERYGEADTSTWFRDVLSPTKAFIDLSYLNHRPAGKNGFIKSSGDKFVMGNGEEIRFWGCNVQAYSLFMKDRELIRIHSKRIAALGFNLVRLHHMDSQAWVKDCLIADGETSQELNKDALDTYFYWIKCLKDEGIYVWVDLHVGRPIREGDKVPGFDELNAKRKNGKGVVEVKGYCYVNGRIKELMKIYNEKLLTSINPHTGTALKDETSVMGFLLTNENELTTHFGNALLGDKAVPYHHEIFKKAVADFADRTGLPQNKLMETWLPGPSKLLLNDMEYKWNIEMIGHLRKIGVKQPVDTCHMWGGNSLFSLPALTAGDMIDVHAYTNGEFLLKSPRSSANFADYIARSQVSGMPLTITEWNFEDNAPGRDEYVNPLITAAMAAFQGWDAPMLYGYSQDSLGGKNVSSWSSHNYPNIIGVMPAAALMYREGHVRGADKTFVAKLDRENLFMKGDGNPETAFRTLSLMHRVAVALPEVKELPWLKASQIPGDATVFTDLDKDFIPAGQSFVESDTGELRHDWEKGLFIVNTPKSQGFAGWARGNRIELKNSSFSIGTPKAAVMLTSLDTLPIGNSKKILLTAVARVEKEKVKWEIKSLSEPVTGALKLKNSSSRMELVPLNGDGSEQDAIKLEKKDNVFMITLPDNKNTCWFLLKGN